LSRLRIASSKFDTKQIDVSFENLTEMLSFSRPKLRRKGKKWGYPIDEQEGKSEEWGIMTGHVAI